MVRALTCLVRSDTDSKSRYVGSGSGRGNPYGLAAVAAVAFPIAMFFRIHFPGPVLTAVFAPVTFGLVLGYASRNNLDPIFC